MTDETAPVRIWLQTGGCYRDACDGGLPSEDITWCYHPIDSADQEYVRADLYYRLLTAWALAMGSNPPAGQKDAGQ